MLYAIFYKGSYVNGIFQKPLLSLSPMIHWLGLYRFECRWQSTLSFRCAEFLMNDRMSFLRFLGLWLVDWVRFKRAQSAGACAVQASDCATGRIIQSWEGCAGKNVIPGLRAIRLKQSHVHAGGAGCRDSGADRANLRRTPCRGL